MLISVLACRKKYPWPLGLLILCIGNAAVAADTVSGWPVATSTYNMATIAALEDAVESEQFKEINSVVVIRGGELLVERYFNGAARDETHNPRSVGKTFASAVAGIALADGYLTSLDQQLGEYYDLENYDNYSEKKSQVTLRQLLTMTSGFDGFDFDPESAGNEENMYPTADWVAWTLNLPMASGRDPGDEWRYFTAGIVVLGDILNRVVPGGLENYAHEQLFAKLGITNYQWQHTPQRVANTAGGIQLTPLDFAKFGELYLRGGRWAGEQVIPESWAADSFRAAVATVVPGNQYGYLWWIKNYEVNGQTLATVYCTGNGGNKIFVFEEQEIVVVITASAYGRRYMHSQVDEMMTKFILPAVL